MAPRCLPPDAPAPNTRTTPAAPAGTTRTAPAAPSPTSCSAPAAPEVNDICFGSDAVSYTASCPAGSVTESVTVNLAPGAYSGATRAIANAAALAAAQAQAEAARGACTWNNVQQTASCPGSSIGDDVVIPAGAYSSTVSQEDADNQAAAAAEAGLSCHWENTEQTATCDEGYTGDPVTIPAGTYTSLVSQEDADAQALAAAEALLECVPLSIDLSIDGRVWDMCPDGSGGFIIVGEFAVVAGVSHVRIARILANGTVDHSFDTDFGGAGSARWIVRLASGKYLVGGTFLSVDGTGRNRIARINADGSLDTGYNPDSNQPTYGAVEQSDLKVVVVGGFTTIAGAARAGIARLNADGTIDSSYDPNPNNTINGIASHTSGRMLVWGTFASVGGSSRPGVAVLNTDGTAYSTFSPTVTGQSLQPKGGFSAADGSVYITGGFNTTYSDSEHTFKLNADGSHATGFVVDHGTNGFGYGVAIDGNGDVLIGGFFTLHNGTTRNYISRCNPATGAVDTGFDPNANFDVYVITPEAGGTYLVGGNYTTMNGVARERFTRLLADGALA